MPENKASLIGFLWLAVPLLSLSLLQSCNKGELKPNQAPDTQISVKEINLTGENRLNSTVRLNWFGTDSDGYVEGFEISFDNQTWAYTQTRDSVFSFSLPAGQDTTDIDFYVRSIDNEGLKDPTPAYLSVPLKNSPPEASFNNATGPGDTALIAATLNWNITDRDGAETVTGVEIKVNDGSWYALNLGEDLISFVLDPMAQSGPATADLYYGLSDNPSIQGIDGFIANGNNTVYLRASDKAGALSPVDTSESFFLKNKSSGADLLWISGQNQSVTDQYRQILNNIGANYDFLHYNQDEKGPSYWNPTFKLILKEYAKLFVNTGQETFTNRVTSQTKTLIEFMAPVVQEYTNGDGKSFITTSFNKEKNLTEISGPYPVSGLVAPSGQARIQPDSALVPLISGNYPGLSPTNVQSGMVPIVPSGDSEAFYRAQLLKLQGWTGTDVVAAIRRPNNIWTQVFFGVELHYYNQDPQKLEQLFQEILINEF